MSFQLAAGSRGACRLHHTRQNGRKHAFVPVCSAAAPRLHFLRSRVITSVGRQPAQLPARGQIQRCSAVPNGKFISSTEVPAFIPRDDLMDQLYRWSLTEAGEGGQRNFGLPMKVDPTYHEERLWGFNVAIFKEGDKLTDLGVFFDKEVVSRHEWVGRGQDGFPVLEGKAEDVLGKNIEIWKLDSNPVSEDLRSAIRAYCTGLVAALNRYYAFGSVFVDDAQ